MTSQHVLIDYVQRVIDLTPEEASQFGSFFKVVTIKKRQFIVQPNFIALHRYFVIQGALRAYVIGSEGGDHTVQLAIENWWISDYNSYMYQQPASMFVVALEDSTLLQISYTDEQTLKALHHKFESFFRRLAERSAAFMQRRLITNLTRSAEARYDLFLETYPELAARIPQYAIASYLGMTTEFLSKIRHQKMKQKS